MCIRDRLRAFGQQAAAGIRNARLYRTAEERRQAAQIFGKMAFNAAAYVHDLRNHISALRTHVQLLQRLDQLPAESQREILASNTVVFARLDKVIQILDNLHEPWRQTADVPTDVNLCLTRALRRAVGDHEQIQATENIAVHLTLGEGLPPVKTAPDMLTEVFKVLIKNAVEAIREKGDGGELHVESRLQDGGRPAIEVLIRDSGIGIRPEHIRKVFEIGWSTKGGKGMGFGLFWAKDYVEGLGASIEFSSTWQEGTSVRLLLPTSAE